MVATSACNWFAASQWSSIPITAPQQPAVCPSGAVRRSWEEALTCSPEQPPLHQAPSWQNHYLVREPGRGIMLDCPLKCTKSASACKKKTYKKLRWMAKWSHLCIKWLLEKDWDTIRVSSLSSPQTNNVQRVLSYESLDLQANVSSLRFSFTKQIFIRRCGMKMHHVWDRCKALLLEFGVAAESHAERHRPSPWQTITTSSPQTVIS